MGYLQALNLLVRAYKAARGVMPKGLDLLKLKMKARQKVIDANKVIKFPPERITNPFKPRNQIAGSKREKGLEVAKDRIKRLKETEAETIARMNRQNKKAAQRIRDKKKPKEDKAEGGITGAIKKIKRRFGKKSITTGDKIKRPGNRQLFDDFKKRNKFNVGGMANLSQTYDNNPTLQAQFPNKQDYLDLFGGIAATSAAPTTYAQMTQQSPATPAAVKKPILPIIPQEGGDGGGPGPKGFTKGYSSANFGLGPNKDVVDYEAEAYGVGRTPLGTASQIITGIPSITKLGFEFAKSVKEKSQQALDNFLAERAREKAIREAQEKARLADELARQMDSVYYDNPGAAFTGGRYDGASSRSEYESNPTGFSGSS